VEDHDDAQVFGPLLKSAGITIYLENDGRLEHVQQMSGHESPRTTKLYDRTKDEITLSEVEQIRP
jgi:integrase/recombinase XerD